MRSRKLRLLVNQQNFAGWGVRWWVSWKHAETNRSCLSLDFPFRLAFGPSFTPRHGSLVVSPIISPIFYFPKHSSLLKLNSLKEWSLRSSPQKQGIFSWFLFKKKKNNNPKLSSVVLKNFVSRFLLQLIEIKILVLWRLCWGEKWFGDRKWKFW